MSNRSNDWKEVLSLLSSILLSTRRFSGKLPVSARATGWCGRPGASEEQIHEAEQRLGISFPPSYRSFLLISNGWEPFDNFIECIVSVQDVNRLRAADPDASEFIPECYKGPDVTDSEYLDYANPEHNSEMRPNYYPDSLLVGRAWPNEGDMILLNPAVMSEDGEWEAIFFANWIPGNQRYPSFGELVYARVNMLKVFEEGNSPR